MGILAWILLGLVAGWLAGLIMKSDRGMLGDMLLGIVGALVGGFLGSLLFGLDVSGFNLTSIVLATLGAMLVIAIARMFTGRRVRA